MNMLKLFKLLLLLTLSGLYGCATTPQELTEFEPIVRPVAPAPPTYNKGSLFQDNSLSMFQDPKPYRIGDVLTIKLQESTSASKSAGTSTSKDEDISMARRPYSAETPPITVKM